MGCQPYQLKVCIRSQTRKWLLQSFVFFWSVQCTFRNGPKFDQSRSPLSAKDADIFVSVQTWLSLMRWMRCQLVCQMALNATAYFWWTVKNAAGFQATVAHGVFKRALQTLTGPWPGSCEPVDLPSIHFSPFHVATCEIDLCAATVKARLVPKNFHIFLWTRVWSTKYS